MGKYRETKYVGKTKNITNLSEICTICGNEFGDHSSPSYFCPQNKIETLVPKSYKLNLEEATKYAENWQIILGEQYRIEATKQVYRGLGDNDYGIFIFPVKWDEEASQDLFLNPHKTESQYNYERRKIAKILGINSKRFSNYNNHSFAIAF